MIRDVSYPATNNYYQMTLPHRPMNLKQTSPNHHYERMIFRYLAYLMMYLSRSINFNAVLDSETSLPFSNKFVILVNQISVFQHPIKNLLSIWALHLLSINQNETLPHLPYPSRLGKFSTWTSFTDLLPHMVKSNMHYI